MCKKDRKWCCLACTLIAYCITAPVARWNIFSRMRQLFEASSALKKAHTNRSHAIHHTMFRSSRPLRREHSHNMPFALSQIGNVWSEIKINPSIFFSVTLTDKICGNWTEYSKCHDFIVWIGKTFSGHHEYQNAFWNLSKNVFRIARSFDFLLCWHYSFCSFNSFIHSFECPPSSASFSFGVDITGNGRERVCLRAHKEKKRNESNEKRK